MDFSTLYKTQTYKRDSFEITLKELTVKEIKTIEAVRKKDPDNADYLSLYYSSDKVIDEAMYEKMPAGMHMELMMIFTELNVPAKVLEKISKNLPSPTAL